MASVFGEWQEIVDLFVKLAPAASIVGGLIAARHQLRNARRINQETIAKNHYREMLELFLNNTDILYLGARDESFAELKLMVPKYRRYRMLFTVMVFAMQELYLSIDKKAEKSWLHMCGMFCSLFRPFILSEDDFTVFMQKAVNPEFLSFMFESARTFSHSAASNLAAKLTDEDRLSALT